MKIQVISTRKHGFEMFYSRIIDRAGNVLWTSTCAWSELKAHTLAQYAINSL